MTQQTKAVLLSALSLLASSCGVHGHVNWIYPPPRPSSSTKSYPCGQDSSFSTGPVTTLKVGMNEVVFDEFVCHTGDMVRIAISMGDDYSYDDHVLLDRLPHNDKCDQNGGKNYHAVNITVPNVDCVNNQCSLQIIQVMSSKFAGTSCANPSGISKMCGSTGHMYYSCAKVRIAGTAKTIPTIFNDFYGSKTPVAYKWPLAANWNRDTVSGNWKLSGPTPQAKSPSTFCFSGETTVVTKSKGVIAMKHLKIGDLVMVAGSKFEQVYSFGHHDSLGVSEFLIINEKLELSPDHMIGVHGKGFVPASTIKLGDMLVSGAGTIAEVTSIQKKKRKGMFAPFTPSGELMVGNILVSSYVTLQPHSSHLKLGGASTMPTGLSFQWLAHTFQFPHRVVCHYLGSCPRETYSSSGISIWVDTPLRLSLWWLDQNAAIMVLCLVPILVTLLFFSFTEAVMTNLWVVAFTAVFLSYVNYSPSKKKSLKSVV
jgi:hypothetical protein